MVVIYCTPETVANTELPHFSVVGYCAETKTVYEFLCCFYHGQTCQPYRDIPTLSEETLVERYERMMSRKEQMTLSGYKVTVVWECEFDEAVMVSRNRNYSLIQ
jgi:G:T-mismatch repair DNA endonuclease (very short patch repair protein)